MKEKTRQQWLKAINYDKNTTLFNAADRLLVWNPALRISVTMEEARACGARNFRACNGEVRADWPAKTTKPITDDLDWQTQDSTSYVACCYGEEGDEPGDVEVCLQSAEDDDGTIWWRLYEPESCDKCGYWDDEDDARAALEEWCDDRDETPDAEDIEERIKATGYFADPDIIPLVIGEMTRHSQGYLLITPDISQPVGTRWTINGYLQCDHLRVDATHTDRAVAADSLLRAIQSGQGGCAMKDSTTV